MNHSISVLLVVLLVGVTHAAGLTPQEDYWKTVLPAGTPMPGAVRDLLRTGNAVRPKRIGVQGCSFSYTCSFTYGGPTSAQEMAHVSDRTIFFLQKDLRPGAKMRLDLDGSSPAGVFISRTEASTIPFSSEKLPDLLRRFSIEPNTDEEQAMKETLQECEKKDPSEESKYCATSLESMVDYATSTLGTQEVRAVSTFSLEVSRSGSVAAKKNLVQEYVVASAPIVRLPGRSSSTVACHPKPWPYALFYCHETPASRAYVVRLVGKDRAAQVEAVAVCHDDTSSWNPSHLAFQLLKVKPGTLPICHFLPKDHIVWAPRRPSLVKP